LTYCFVVQHLLSELKRIKYLLFAPNCTKGGVCLSSGFQHFAAFVSSSLSESRSLSYVRSIDSSRASSPKSAIWYFPFQLPVSLRFPEVT